jgi:hypothetical protein
MQSFNIPYEGEHNYTHEVFYYGDGSGGKKLWEMAVVDNTESQYAYHIETQATGTSLISQNPPSVMFQKYVDKVF